MSNYIFVSHAHKSQTRRHPARPRFTPASCRGRNLTLELLIKRGHVSLGGGRSFGGARRDKQKVHLFRDAEFSTIENGCALTGGCGHWRCRHTNACVCLTKKRRPFVISLVSRSRVSRRNECAREIFRTQYTSRPPPRHTHTSTHTHTLC